MHGCVRTDEQTLAYHERTTLGEEGDVDVDGRAWLESLAITAPTDGAENGENTMDAYGFDDDETSPHGERSGVYSTTADEIGAVEIADVELPDVDQIDALPSKTTAAQEAERREEAIDSLSLVSVETLYSLLGDMLARVPEDRVTALICTRVCGLSDSGIATVVEQGRLVLENKYSNAKTVTGAALLAQRETESALIAALGPYASGVFKAVG